MHKDSSRKSSPPNDVNQHAAVMLCKHTIMIMCGTEMEITHPKKRSRRVEAYPKKHLMYTIWNLVQQYIFIIIIAQPDTLRGTSLDEKKFYHYTLKVSTRLYLYLQSIQQTKWMNGRASYNNFISLLAFEEFSSFSEQETQLSRTIFWNKLWSDFWREKKKAKYLQKINQKQIKQNGNRTTITSCHTPLGIFERKCCSTSTKS